MKKKFIWSTIILLLGGLITKVLGMIIKIVMTRNIGVEGLSLYMLILPTLSLFISLGQIGLPIALSRLVALGNKNNKRLFLSVIPITLIINLIFSFIIIILSSFISGKLLHNNDISLGILAIGLVIPFTSLSSICRSYFFGKERMFPHVFSSVVESIIRLIFMMFVLPKVLFLDLKYIIFILVISNVLSEAVSTIILLIFIPRNISISLRDFKPNFEYIHASFKLGIPNVGSSLISSFSYFLEPIILTNILLYIGYSNTYIIREYGIITGYVIPLLLLPSFFTLAISQAIMPYVSREYLNKNYNNIIRRLFSVCGFILVISLIIIVIYELYGNILLKVIYDTDLGYNYLKILAPFFILQYVQSIFSFSLNGMGKVKDIFYLSIISSTSRVLVIILLSFTNIGIYSYLVSIIINIIISTFYLIYRLIYYLK